MVELFVLSGRYIEKHTTTRICERKITEEITGEFPGESAGGEELYGIGFEAGKGELFWFHKRTENVDRQEP